jgi:transcriptional regulator with XRE-family HTH domain
MADVALEFADRLARMMQDKGLSQSDLSRLAWGSNGNRNLISMCLKGRSLPEKESLQKIAGALGCTPEELLPAAARPLTRAKEHREFQMWPVAGEPGLMQISINMTMSIADAIKFLDFYNRVTKAAGR